MAFIQVTSDTEAALISALATAGDGDTIQFTTAGTITLSSTLTISKSITIDGAATGGGTITLQGTNSFTDVTVTAGTVVLTNLSITDGAGTGTTGIAGTSGSANGGNGGDAAGGVFNNGGVLTVSNVTFVNDTATGGSGGNGYSWTTFDGAGGGGGGAGGSAAGAIFNEAGTVTIANLTFTNVTATGGTGGQGGNGAGAFSAQSIPDLGFGGLGSNGGTDGQGGIDGQSGNPPGGGVGAFGGFGGTSPTVGATWSASTAGSTGDAGSGQNGLGGGGGGGGAGGTSFQGLGGLSAQVPCFAAGTRIATMSGDVPVEQLRAGHRARLAGGGTAEIVWVGHRRVRVAQHPRPHDVNPIRVAADAFGPHLPARDLFLSPDHAVFVDGVLVPIRYLRNGATIATMAVESVTYYHVELAAHDVLLAEGLPAESFLDTGNRRAFANGGTVVMAHPDFALAVWRTQACAPLVTSGPILASLRARLLERATANGFALTQDGDPSLLVDGVTVHAQSCVGTVWRFMLPTAASAVRLISRHVVPAEIFAHHADGRRLGVAVTSVIADGQPLAIGAFDTRAGWHQAEPGLRWTDGDAALPVCGATRVDIDIAPLLHYWAEHSVPEQTLRSA